MYDIAIIGGGVIGCAVARQLSKYELQVAVLEARADVAMGASGANSGIVHAGYDCAPGSLMARMNVLGNELYTQWAQELCVPLERIGSLVVGFDEVDFNTLQKLKRNGDSNGVKGLQIISGDEVRGLSPGISQKVTHGLYAPTCAITCPYEMTFACFENARENGVTFLMDFEVISIECGFLLTAKDGRQVKAKMIVNCGGVYADDIAKKLGDDTFHIHPRKGEYMLFDNTCRDLVKMVIFQTPNESGKGVLVSKTVDGNAYVGPTALDQEDKSDNTLHAESFSYIVEKAEKSVVNIPWNKVITSFAGVRAIGDKHDFIIGHSTKCQGLINVGGICSPGLSSAPAIADYVRDLVGEKLTLKEKRHYSPHRFKPKAFREMNGEERSAAINGDPRCAKIVCRCETVSEADVLLAIERGATTLDGVKRRTRAGMGRCQGGFCSPRIMEILAHTLNKPMEEITKFGGKSYIVCKRIGECDEL